MFSLNSDSAETNQYSVSNSKSLDQLKHTFNISYLMQTILILYIENHGFS